MSMTTLEEVFMSVSNDHEGEAQDVAVAAGADAGMEKFADAGVATADSAVSGHSAKEDIGSTAYMAKHIWVMVYKRLLMFHHDYAKQVCSAHSFVASHCSPIPNSHPHTNPLVVHLSTSGAGRDSLHRHPGAHHH